jgi:hypothetical protein
MTYKEMTQRHKFTKVHKKDKLGILITIIYHGVSCLSGKNLCALIKN